MLKNLVKKFFGSSEAVSTGAETLQMFYLYMHYNMLSILNVPHQLTSQRCLLI